MHRQFERSPMMMMMMTAMMMPLWHADAAAAATHPYLIASRQ